MDTSRQDLLQAYDLEEDFPQTWSEAGVSSDIQYDTEASGAGELSKYSLLKELARKNNASYAGGLPDDEADPLGSTPSVMSVLRARGIGVDNPTVKGHYFISSRSFEPRTFLRDVHIDASFANLQSSLHYLESSIAKRSEALRGLVEHDYDKFVKSKAALDSVFDQIEKTGFTAENDWKLATVSHLIDDANAKATMIMKPVIDHQRKEERLKASLELIERNRYIFNLPSLIVKHIRTNDHEGLVRDYRRGRDMRYQDDLSADAPDNVVSSQKVTDRIWREVEVVVDDYKKVLWKELAKAGTDQHYLQIISKLLELGVEDNPIVEWISSRMSYFDKEANETFDKLRLRTNLMAMNIAAVPPNIESSFYNPIKQMMVVPNGDEDGVFLCDAMEVIEMWLIIKSILDELSRLMQDACTFWQICRGFIEGQKQAGLPTGYQDESRIHLVLSQIEVENINRGGKALADIFMSRLVEYFTSSSRSVAGAKQAKRLSFHQSSADSFLFMPPYANALGAARYLSKSLNSLAGAIQEVSRSSISPLELDNVRNILSLIRDRTVFGICSAWEEDSKKFALIENWTILPQNKSRTMFPKYLLMYCNHVLNNLKNITYFVPDNMETPLLGKPSSKLIAYIHQCYIQAISSTLENVSFRVMSGTAVSLSSNPNSNSSLPVRIANSQLASELSPQEISQEAKSLVTLSNFAAIREDVLPATLKVLEEAFRTPVKDVSISVRRFIEQLEGPLFDAYTRKKRSLLSEIVRHGINKSGIDWKGQESLLGVSAYMHDALIELVVVHAKVADIAPALIDQVIKVLYGHLLKSVLATIREVEQFGTAGCLQALADVEFLRRVMAKYKTGDSTQTVQNIYTTLKEASIDRHLWGASKDPRRLVEDQVAIAIENSKLDYSSFQASSI